MEDQVADVVEIVRQIKTAIAKGMPDDGLQLEEVELELKTSVEKTLDGSFKIKVLELGADLSQTSVQSVSLTLHPEAMGGDVETLSVEEDLLAGITLIRQAVREAGDSAPLLALTSAVVALEFGKTREGKVKLFVGGTIAKETAQIVKLKIKGKT